MSNFLKAMGLILAACVIVLIFGTMILFQAAVLVMVAAFYGFKLNMVFALILGLVATLFYWGK